ncbi:hypothetical protein TKK_0018536 [Trichogramma kaykai]
MSKDSPKSNNSSGSKKKRANHHRHQQHQKTIKFRCDYSSTPLKVLQSRGWSRIHDSQDSSWDLWWCDTSDLRQALDAQRLRPQQRVSHFRNHCELTRKNYLYRNLKRYRRLLLKAGKTKEAELCDAMPISFELPSEYRMLIEEHRKKHGTTWIVKPSQGSQGRGIFLFQRLRDLVEWKGKECVHPSSDLADYEPGKEQPSQMNYLVQKYIDDPYLIDGCKFDLRLYVLVTSFQPLKVWLAREGFARLSGEQFSLERIDDNRVHLTNMSIQLRQPRASSSSVNNDAGDKDCEVKLGRKWPLSCLKKYLSDRHGERVIDQLIHNIAGIIMASLQAVQSIIIPGKNSFELYGYDVILDERLKPWLLEVNASPSLSATDSHDFRLKFDLIDDVLNILDFERLLTGRETRVGGFDLLWNDGPVWYDCGTYKRLNIFLGAPNDRVENLQELRDKLKAKKTTTTMPSASR